LLYFLYFFNNEYIYMDMMTSFKMAQPPLSTGFPGNAGSPRDAAMAINKQNTDLLMAANKIGKGGRKRGGASTVVVPLMKPLFQDPSAGTDQSVKSVTLSGVGQINQQSLNNKMIGSVVTPAQPIPASQLPVKTGGSCGCDWKGGKRSNSKKRRTRRMGGTRIMGPNQTWGCYSGGKGRKRKMSKRRKLSKKKRLTRRR
jgi:hypothetical protein